MEVEIKVDFYGLPITMIIQSNEKLQLIATALALERGLRPSSIELWCDRRMLYLDEDANFCKIKNGSLIIARNKDALGAKYGFFATHGGHHDYYFFYSSCCDGYFGDCKECNNAKIGLLKRLMARVLDKDPEYCSMAIDGQILSREMEEMTMIEGSEYYKYVCFELIY